jgi:hypothetical protein
MGLKKENFEKAFHNHSLPPGFAVLASSACSLPNTCRPFTLWDRKQPFNSRLLTTKGAAARVTNNSLL